MYNRRLETFIKIADCGSFSKAAEALYISPTAVIKQINLLERELEICLFERTHKGIRLTEAGKSIYDDAKYLIQYSKNSIIKAKKEMQKAEKIIRIGNSFMTPAQYIIELWPKLKEYCSDIKFKIVNYDNSPENAREILSNLGKNIDIVPGWFDDNLLNNNNCDAIKLEDEELYCALPITHRLAFSDCIDLEDLPDETVMCIKRGWNKNIDVLRDEIQKKYPKIKIADIQFFSIDSLNQAESKNCAVIGPIKWKNVNPLLKFVPMKTKCKLPFGIFHSKEPSPIVSEFLCAAEKICN